MIRSAIQDKEGECFMSKNEIRGYIFMGFALLCFCTDCIVKYRDYTLFSLQIMFIIACIICFGLAYVEKHERDPFNSDISKKILRPKQFWIEYEVFNAKINKVFTKFSADKTQMQSDIHFLINNQQIKQKGDMKNFLTIQLSAIGDFGMEKEELYHEAEPLNSIAPGAWQEIVYTIEIPNKCDRVMLYFTVEAESTGAIYEQEFEIYPKHYVK